MSIKYQIHNILHNLIYRYNKSTLNVLYAKANSIYDLVINDIPDHVFLPQSMIDSKIPVSYGLCIVNDPLQFSQNINTYKILYANKILFFHKLLPKYLKKEDIYLISNELSSYPIYTFNPDIIHYLPSAKSIKYGFVDNVKKTASERNIDVIITYTEEQKQAEMISGVLRNNNYKVETICINKINNSEEIISKLNNAKICIDTTDYYNALFAVSCGCCGITTNKSHDDVIHIINNFENCLITVEKLLNEYNDSYIDSNKNYLLNNYPNELFVKSIIEIIQNHYYKAVKL